MPADWRAAFIFATNCDSIDALVSANAAVGATVATVVVTAPASTTAANKRVRDPRTTRNDTGTSGVAPERSPRRVMQGHGRSWAGGLRPSAGRLTAPCGVQSAVPCL